MTPEERHELGKLWSLSYDLKQQVFQLCKSEAKLLEVIGEAVEWIEDDRFDDEYIAEEWYHKMKDILYKERKK